MSAIVTYRLSTAGQKASILSGGNGKQEQEITVPNDSPEFARVVQRGDVKSDGSVVLGLLSWDSPSFDAPQTAASILDHLEAKVREKAEAEQREIDERYAETLLVLTKKETKTESTYFGMDRNGKASQHSYVDVRVSAKKPAWPYQADKRVTESAEAKAWLEELAIINAREVENATDAARVQVAAKLAAEEKAAAEQAELDRVEDERKVTLGGEVTDLLLSVEDGALTDVPDGCWETHKRGKNWLAVISPNPASPGGLARSFQDKARGSSYYMVAGLSVGDAVEFGADCYSGSGRKSPTRWHGFVVAIAEDAIIFRKCAGGKTAHKAGQAWRSKCAV